MIQQTKRRDGFTLIELMLAMTFVAILLLTIAMTIVQMGTVYNRGMTLKEVNQSARDVADDLRRNVQAAGVFNVGTGPDTTDYVKFSRVVDGNNVVVSGRLCLGNYTYIWNTATAIETNFADRARYLTSSGAVGDTVNFVKIADTGKKYCIKNSSGALINKNILYADASSATELLKPGDRTIRMLHFAVSSSDTAYDATAGQRLYQFSYTLGTGQTSTMVMTAGIPTACLGPNEENSNLAYCNVQQFGIVLRAGNTVN